MAENDRTKQGSVLRQEGKVSDSVAAFVRKVGAVARPNAGQDGRLLFFQIGY